MRRPAQGAAGGWGIRVMCSSGLLCEFPLPDAPQGAFSGGLGSWSQRPTPDAQGLISVDLLSSYQPCAVGLSVRSRGRWPPASEAGVGEAIFLSLNCCTSLLCPPRIPGLCHADLLTLILSLLWISGMTKHVLAGKSSETLEGK